MSYDLIDTHQQYVVNIIDMVTVAWSCSTPHVAWKPFGRVFSVKSTLYISSCVSTLTMCSSL